MIAPLGIQQQHPLVDGRVSESEIQAAHVVMAQMNLNPSMRCEAIRLFTQGKQPDFNLTERLHQFSRVCHSNRLLLQMFVEIQMKAAYAGGALSVAKRRALQNIIQLLGLRIDVDYFDTRYRAEQGYGSYSPHSNPRNHLQEAYKVLGVPSNASDADVKKAYRRLMGQHHPDKLVSKGLPEEMLKLATEKVQKIKAAYEQVREARRRSVGR